MPFAVGNFDVFIHEKDPEYLWNHIASQISFFQYWQRIRDCLAVTAKYHETILIIVYKAHIQYNCCYYTWLFLKYPENAHWDSLEMIKLFLYFTFVAIFNCHSIFCLVRTMWSLIWTKTRRHATHLSYISGWPNTISTKSAKNQDDVPLQLTWL